jgi:tripartite-type tricarboxylate transporter receptor subunit TctC
MAICLGLLGVATTRAQAQSSDAISAFYKGRQVTLYIGNAVGGGYDTYARLIGRYIGKYIPGNPSVVAENMVGAGGGLLVSHLINNAPRDGSVIAALPPGAITLPLYMTRPYQTRSLIYLGNANSEHDSCWVRSEATVKTYQDVFEHELIIGGSASGDTSIDLPTLQNNILGTKFKIIAGYTGTHEVFLAQEKGEVQGLCGSGMPTVMTERGQWVESGLLKPLVQENPDGDDRLNKLGVPHSPDFAKSEADREALDLVYIQQKFGRPYAMPPGVPADRAAALRKAFMDALSDKDLLADAKKINLDILPMSGQQLQTIVEGVFNTPPDIVARAKAGLGYKDVK